MKKKPPHLIIVPKPEQATRKQPHELTMQDTLERLANLTPEVWARARARQDARDANHPLQCSAKIG